MRKYNDVTLVDGTVVDSGTEAWRLECEARHVLALPTKAERQNYLNGYRRFTGEHVKGILQRRGEAARDQLQELILAVWHAKRAAP